MTRYSELIDGDLGLTLTTVGGTTTASLSLNSPRGDASSEVTLSAAMTAPGGISADGVDAWRAFTEYGAPQQTVDNSAGGTTGIGYGWVGGKQRATDRSGLLTMGARLYNTQTGSFSSRDPIAGGNETGYNYPNDPVDSSDLSGEWCYLQIGTTCTRYATDWLGNNVPVKYKARMHILHKHGLTLGMIQHILPRLRFVRTENRGSIDLVFEGTAAEKNCTWWGCYYTGRTVRVRAIESFSKDSDKNGGKTIGLKTMYCIGYKELCPSWFRRNPMN